MRYKAGAISKTEVANVKEALYIHLNSYMLATVTDSVFITSSWNKLEVGTLKTDQLLILFLLTLWRYFQYLIKSRQKLIQKITEDIVLDIY